MNPASSSPWIVNTTDETFDTDVIERSKTVPVVVDFWATWCAPCRALGPILEQLTEEFAGKFVLVKADTEQAPQAAGRFGVAGIPAVYGVLDGKPIDMFQGALPEAHVRMWLAQIAQKADLLAAKQLVATDPVNAIQSLQMLRDQAPEDADIAILLAQTQLEVGNSQAALDIITALEARGFLEPEAENLKAAIELQAKAGVDVAAARAAADANPDDFGMQLALAEGLAGAGEYVEALEICLSLVMRDRKQTGESARQLMVDVFRVLPSESEVTREYRRKLSSALY
ncbi:MAG: tetratricopeptide repeat protein [Planctomycetales bacterium]|nr:tetratricopeptide repeat protein [Planctomycetales bacterium]